MRKLLEFSLVFSFLFSIITLQAQEFGIASFYSDSFHGRKTASGELYDKNKLTAGHKTHPYGTILLVTRLDNKKSVRVRVNDRGPYVSDRLIEVSRKAGETLGIIEDESAKVKVEVVGKGSLEKEEAIVSTPPPPAEVAPTKPAEFDKPEPSKTETNPAPVEKKPEPKPQPKVEDPPVRPKPKLKTQPATPPLSPPASRTVSDGFGADVKLVKGKNYSDFDLYKIQVLRPEKNGYGVQVASLTNYQNVLRQIAELQEKFFTNILLSIERGPADTPVYKIILGPFPDLEKATGYKKQLKKKKKMAGFVVDLEGIEY